MLQLLTVVLLIIEEPLELLCLLGHFLQLHPLPLEFILLGTKIRT